MKAKQLMKAKGVEKKYREDLHQQTNKNNCQSRGSCE